jgi:hypothetical protein
LPDARAAGAGTAAGAFADRTPAGLAAVDPAARCVDADDPDDPDDPAGSAISGVRPTVDARRCAEDFVPAARGCRAAAMDSPVVDPRRQYAAGIFRESCIA